MNATPLPALVRTPTELLEAATAAAHEAAEYIRGIDRTSISREYKTSSHDIVTLHDKACEDIIVAALHRAVPEARIVGEEGGVRESDSPVTFFVDPIDGTSNFAAGLPLFCISIGAAIGDEIVAGVVDAPILGQVFTAADGPAMLNGQELTPRPTRAAADALVVSGFPGQHVLVEQEELSLTATRRLHAEVSAVRHLGSAALELAYVAAGFADATGLGRINAWDVAAGFHLVRRAGGSIRTWPGRGPADAPDHERPAYVACTGTGRLDVFDELMDQLQEVRTGTA
ncbi:inositol monophosphatase family protein [Brachybacterium phenoliresistens]|uniref:Inositol monophosphatase n=1 Tax=Brachybacterium phenoliresistens TaxID=396014 RepID=Z9JQX2_9MICO|nr:inositol monophosphatase family protein [Brachybacterium phenoliresistens]EWS80564.1 inositol monophosphatase [Brachybacterium phenoliresistens]